MRTRVHERARVSTYAIAIYSISFLPNKLIFSELRSTHIFDYFRYEVSPHSMF